MSSQNQVLKFKNFSANAIQIYQGVWSLYNSWYTIPLSENHQYNIGVQAEVDWYKNDVKIEAERSRYMLKDFFMSSSQTFH